MKAGFSFSVICFLCSYALGQSVSTLMGSRQAAMAYASSTTIDEWALFNNVGAIGRANQSSVAFAYEAVPALIGANRMAALYNLPLKWSTVALGAFRFGDAIYNEQIVSAGIGNQFGITSLGIKINFVQYSAEGFGTQRSVSLDFGGVTQLSDQISIGAYVVNLTQSGLQTQDGEKLPTKLVLGLGFKPSENVFVTTDIEKDIDYKTTWRTGVEFVVYKNLFFRTGYSLTPSAGSFGIGYRKKNLKIDYAIRLSQSLSSSHQASASYIISSKSKK